MKNQINELDFTPQGKIEKEMNFAQAVAVSAVIVIILLIIGNLVIGLD